jgi:hypothetical protein
MGDRETTGANEAAGRERRQRTFVRSALDVQPALDDAERALRVRGRRRRRQREPRSDAVISTPVVEGGRDPHCPLARVQFEAGRHLYDVLAGANTVEHPLGPAEPASHAQPGPDGPLLFDLHGDRLGAVDHAILCRR